MSNLHLRLLGMSGRLYSLLRQRNVLAAQGFHSGCRLQCTNSNQNNGEVNHEREQHQRRQLNQPVKPASRQAHKLTKLHNRTLTGEEQEYEKKQYERFSSLDESDTFGNIQKSQNRKLDREEPYKFGRMGRPERSKFSFHGGTEKARFTDDSFNVQSPRASSPQVSGYRRRHRNRGDFDTFGSLSEADTDVGWESVSTEIGSHNERFPDDDGGERDHHIRLSADNRRHTQAWYGRQIEKFGKAGKIKEAVAVLDDWMLKRDRVLPNQYNFTVLIGVLGRVGYTKKAFKLFNKMKKMGLQPEDPTYTALFNACANSPWRTDGLTRANNLRNLMQIKGYEPNLTTYQAMMKAYGLLGDIKTAFVLMDELVRRFRPTAETFSFLLMACISDKRAGFKHSVEVWRLLQQHRVTPDLPLYNLLLRAVRDCGAGDAHFANQLLLSENQEVKRRTSSKSAPNAKIYLESEQYASESVEDATSDVHLPVRSHEHQRPDVVKFSDTNEWWENSGDVQSSSLQLSEDRASNLPNLLDSDPDLSQVISIGELRRPEERLAVIGGVAGILESMAQDKACPDVRTFTQLIEVAPPTVEAETALLAKMETLGVKPDIALFNTLIHRRCFRRDADAARSLLKLISAAHLHPDMQTFACLAMTCRNRWDGMQLLKDMEQSGLSPNIEVLGTLAYASNLDFGYKLVVLQHVESLGLSPNDKFIEVIERSIAIAKQKIVQVERGLAVNNFINSDYFSSSFAKFMTHYKTWLHRTRPQERTHPWEDFRTKKEEQTEAQH